MRLYTPQQFAHDLEPLRPALLRYACETRPCQTSDGEDMVSDAVRIALLILERFTGNTSLFAWMRAIVRNIVMKAQEDAQESVQTIPLIDAVTVPYQPNTSYRDAMQPHVDALSGHLRGVFNDHLDGYTQEEISTRRKIGIKTVRKRIREAIVELRLGFPDNEKHWITFFDSCGEHATYTAPSSMAEYWRKKLHPSTRQRAPKRLRGAERRRQAMAAHTATETASSAGTSMEVYTGWKGVRHAS